MMNRKHSDAIAYRLMLAIGLAMLSGFAVLCINPTTLRVEHRVDNDWHVVEHSAIRIDHRI